MTCHVLFDLEKDRSCFTQIAMLNIEKVMADDKLIHHRMQVAPRKFKVVVVGDTFTGKTSIINRTCFDKEPIEDEVTTIGPSSNDYTPRLVDENCRLSIWDTAGQERYRSIVPVYFRDASVIIVVFDVTKRQTFENLPYWLSCIGENASQRIPIIIAGNKMDLFEERNVSYIEAREWCDHVSEYKIISYVETSAKTGEGIAEVFDGAAEYLLKSNSKCDTQTNADIAQGDSETKSCC